jgi:hypothetical protein
MLLFRIIPVTSPLSFVIGRMRLCFDMHQRGSALSRRDAMIAFRRQRQIRCQPLPPVPVPCAPEDNSDYFPERVSSVGLRTKPAERSKKKQ